MRETKARTQWTRRFNAVGAVRLVVAASLMAGSFCVSAAPPEVKKVIFDQDFNGIIGGDADPLVMLLQAPNIQVLGVTVITGDGWLRQETAEALKLLEDLHRTDIPVYMGAEFPLVQSPKNLVRLTHMYGGSRTDPFLGAYGEFSEPPDVIVAPPGGFAKKQAEKEPAAEFIIEQVHKYPHEVTLYCGGPLTNVALAIKLDPSVVALTKEIVFMGTSPQMQPKTVNVMYDPESAQIVLHAAWPKLTLITVDVAEMLHRTPEMAAAIAKGGNPAEVKLYEELVMKPYREHKPLQWFRMPDELTAAYIIDPTIVTEMRRYYVDVDTMQGMSYGSSIYWDEVPKGYGGIPWPDKPEPKRQKPVPPVDARVADVVWDFDAVKLQAMFLKAMTEPMRAVESKQ